MPAWRPFPTVLGFLVLGFRKSRTTLFEKMDLVRPLRPNRHVENDRILIISLWGFRKKRVTKSRKPLIFLSVFNVFEKKWECFFWKNSFSFSAVWGQFLWSDVSCLKVVGKSQMVVGKSQMVVRKSQRAATTGDRSEGLGDRSEGLGIGVRYWSELGQ